MAVISYSNLFDRLNVLIKYFNFIETRQTSESSTNYPLPYIKNQIIAPFNTQSKTQEISTIESDFTNAIVAQNTLKVAILTWFETILRNNADALGISSTIPTEILEGLAAAMLRDSQSIVPRVMILNASDVASPNVVVPHASNVGTGSLLYTFEGPGLSPCEISHVETLRCRCTAASRSTAQGQEMFRLSGTPKQSRESYLPQGSGNGPTLYALGTSIPNGNFEAWTGDAADYWTAVVGAWGTEILESASSYESDAAVITAFAEGDWKITTPIPIALAPNTTYAMALYAKKAAGATGTLRFGLSNGNTVSAFVASCVASVDVTALTTDYTLQHLIFTTPSAIDSSWTLAISMDTPGTADIYFDFVQFGQMTRFNGLAFAIIAGVTPFGIGDCFGQGSDSVGFSVEEDSNGIIQKFIGRCFGVQLPSDSSNTISDPT